MSDFTSVFTQERDHWQGRAEAAEAELARLKDLVAEFRKRDEVATRVIEGGRRDFAVIQGDRDRWMGRAASAEAEVERLRGALDRMMQRLKADIPLDHEPFSALSRRNVIAAIEGVLRGEQ